MNDSAGKPVIVFINHWARRIGGAELSLLDILDGLNAHAQVHLITTETGPLTKRAESLYAHCHIIPCNPPLERLRREHLLSDSIHSLSGLIGFTVYLYGILRLLRQLKPELVHANVPKSHIALLLLRFLGYKGVCCFHIREIFPAASVARLLYKILWPSRRVLAIAISHAVRENLPARIRKDTQVIHNGVYVPLNPRTEPAPQIRFIYLGRIVPWKGCIDLVEAFSRLTQSRSDADLQFTLAGDTSYADDSYRTAVQKRIDELNLSGVCTMLPFTPDPYALLAKHSIMLMASLQEPFGRSAAEAHACGLPVIAFDGGGITEIVEQNVTGVLVPYGDLQALVTAMEAFVDNPGKISVMGNAAHKRIQNRFNKTVQVPLIRNLLLRNTAD